MQPDRKQELASQINSLESEGSADELGGVSMETAVSTAFMTMGLALLGTAIHENVSEGDPAIWYLNAAAALGFGTLWLSRSLKR